MSRAIYECVNCGHREEIDSTEPVLEKACPQCGGDMVLVGFLGGTAEQESSEVLGTLSLQSPLPPKLPEAVEELLARFYRLEFESINGNVFVYEVKEILESDFETVLKELEKIGYWAALKKRNGRVLLFVFPAQEIKEGNSWLPWIFLIATLVTTFMAGYYQAILYISFLDKFNLPGLRNPYLIALSFSVSVMAILGTHEMGHKIAAVYHGVKATVPYFIPFPNLIGTMGALIRVKSPIPTRNAAIDLGVSGPIAGFLVAIPISIIGMKLSVAVPQSAIPPTEGGITLGGNLFFYLLGKYLFPIPDGYILYLHPVAMAGWVGILVTFLNLIPAAQLDGGHIARAFLSEKAHRYFTIALGFALIGLGFLWVGWMIWAVLILFMGSMGNPGALDEVSPISKKRIVLAVIAVIIFVLSATPVPFSAS